MSKKIKRFSEYEKKFNKEIHVVLLSKKSKRVKPHFFRTKATANKKAKQLRKTGLKAKVKPYRKSHVIYFK